METAGRGTPPLREQAPDVSLLRHGSGSFCWPPRQPATQVIIFLLFPTADEPRRHACTVNARAPESHSHSLSMVCVERRETVCCTQAALVRQESHDQAGAYNTVAKSFTASSTVRKVASLSGNVKTIAAFTRHLLQVADHCVQSLLR